MAPKDLPDEQFRTAVFVGMASIPFTAGENWIVTTDATSVTALFLACTISGYIYASRSVNGGRAGALTGFTGGAPIIGWQCWVTLTEWWHYPALETAVGDSSLMIAVSAGAALVTGIILFALLLVLGALGGIIGSWSNSRIDTVRTYVSGT